MAARASRRQSRFDALPSRARHAYPQRTEPVGIAVHDHIIVGKDGHASLKGLKLI
jgi:DNA repair protein RadC